MSTISDRLTKGDDDDRYHIVLWDSQEYKFVGLGESIEDLCEYEEEDLRSAVGVSADQGGVQIVTGDTFVPLILICGESNSGGYAENSDLSPEEAAARPCVQILDNIGLAEFQDLDIGTNNLVGHSGLSTNATHGWENALANSVDDGQWWDDVVYLVKAGQGGSKIDEWEEGDSYWTTLVARMEAAIDLIKTDGKVPLIYVWYTLGINDAIAGTNEATWKTNVEAFFVRLRTLLGPVPIFYSEVMAGSSGFAYNDSIEAMDADDPLLYIIQADDATTRDANHWDYDGMKLIGQRMVDGSLSFGQHYTYLLSMITGVYGSAPVISEGEDPPPEGSGVGDPVAVVWNGTLTKATDSGDGKASYTSGGTPAGASSTTAIDLNADFEVIIYYFDAATSNATVVYLDTTHEGNYVWSSDLDFIAGIYQYSGTVYGPVGGYAATETGKSISSFPAAIKLVRNGDDIDYYSSDDNGETWDDTPFYTGTDALVDLETGFLKVIWAAPSNGQYITVELATPVEEA